MRRKSKKTNVKLGQTIVAERERAESDSERMKTRKKARRRKKTSILIVILMLTVLGLLGYMWMVEFAEERRSEIDMGETVEVRAEIVDEDNRGKMSLRMKTYIMELERALVSRGYVVTRVTLPTGMSRELYVDLEGKEMYFKVNLDRGASATAEDIAKMIKYLEERDIRPEYVDVRVDGKAYYK